MLKYIELRKGMFWGLLLSCLFFISGVSTAVEQSYILDGEMIRYDYSGQGIIASGDVLFSMADLQVNADDLVVDFSENILQAGGKYVLLKQGDREIKGEYLEYDFGEYTGYLYGAHSEVANVFFSGGVINLYSDREYEILIEEAAFTPCKLDKPHYQIKSSAVRIYPQQRIGGTDIELWWRDSRLLALPGYVVNYEEIDGEYRFSHPFPLPHLGYNSGLGFQAQINYPYQIGDNINGLLELGYEQRGQTAIRVENEWQFHSLTALESNLIFGSEDDLFYEGYTGFRFEPVSDLIIQSGVSFCDNGDTDCEGQPVIKNRLFYEHGRYELEILADYYMSQKKAESGMDEALDAEVTLKAELADNTQLVLNREINETRTSALLEHENSYHNSDIAGVDQLTGELMAGLEYLFVGSQPEEVTGQLDMELLAARKDNLSQQLALETELKLDYSGTYEYYSKKSQQELLVGSGITLGIAGQEEHTYWKPELGVQYDLVSGDWKQVTLGLTREYDCFGWGFNYDFKNDIINFSINF